MTKLDKQLTLLFRLATEPFKLNELDELDQHKYTCMRQLPLAEMMCTSPVELIEEAITITVSSSWRRQGRRPLMCGDVVMIGPQPWLITKQADWKTYNELKPHNVAALPLSTWPNYIAVNLPDAPFKDALCES